MTTPKPPCTNGYATKSPTSTAIHQRTLNAMARLRAVGWLSNAAPVTTATRNWPNGTVDTVIVFSPQTAHARRDVSGIGMVISDTGSVEDVVAKVLSWPIPGTPGEPVEPLPEHPHDYT